MGEVTVTDVSSERADGVRDPAHENATGRQRCGYVIEGLENLPLGAVLEQVGGRDRRVVTRMPGEDSAEVSLTDPGYACGMGEGRLLWTDIDALCVKTIRLQQPDELAPPAAYIDDGADRGRRQRGRMSRR